MSSVPAPLTIGLPVYNGENYLATSLDDLLAQEFSDFQLILADNASEDATEEICRDYAARDERIRFVRHETNRGGVWNYNFTFLESRSPLFKWATHDDGHAPSYLRRCIEVMAEAPPSVVLVYPRTALIGPDGELLNHYEDRLDLRDASAAKRIERLVRRVRKINALLGVIRAPALASTRLNQQITGYDNLLLAELALRGEFWEIPEELFFRRIHPDAASVREGFGAKLAWMNPQRGQRGHGFPVMRRMFAHLEAIQRAPISGREKFRAHLFYLPAHARARLRHRRWQIRRALLDGARSTWRHIRPRRVA